MIVCSAPETPRGFDLAEMAGVQARIECDAVPNDCLVTTRRTFDELGGFAECFGGELEGIDFCLRARESGGRVVFEPAAGATRPAAPAGPDQQGTAGQAAFDERWQTRVEHHENFLASSELTGTIVRSEFFRDTVIREPIPVPPVAVLVHGDVPSPEFVASLSSSRMKPASAAYAAAADAVRAARTMTEVRGPGYVAFVRSDTVLAGDWLNELQQPRSKYAPLIGLAAYVGRLHLTGARLPVAPHRIPQHLRIEPNTSFDASLAAWMRAIIDVGRSVVAVEGTWARTAIGTGPGCPLPDSVKAEREPFASIIMLSWNAPEYTEIAIASIRAHTRVPHEIIIIDNGSGVETTSRLEKIDGIRVIYNAVNTGFAFGCNQGLAAATGTHLVLLNNDVVATDGWLEALIEVQRLHRPSVAARRELNEAA